MKFGELLLLLGGVAAELAPPTIVFDADNGPTAFLFETPAKDSEKEVLNEAFLQVMKRFEESFEHDHHESFLAETDAHTAHFKNSVAFSGYKTGPSQPQCEGGNSFPVALRNGGTAAMSPFPGGIVSRIKGFSLAKLVDELASKAQGAAAAQGGIGGVVGIVALSMTAAFVQSIISDAIHIIPPLIPPPIWNNQPLMCLPMVTGHNCFGAVFHLISTSDFITADVTDSRLDGIIASFPETFQAKVGPAPDSLYKACFAAYMSMHCASIFPKCLAPQTGNDPTTAAPQRVPMCFTYCITTLLACPGFWIDDVIGQCQDISVPPVCSTAFFWRQDLLPPQLTSFEGSMPSAAECPEELGLEGAVAGAAGVGGAAAGAGGAAAGIGGAETVGTTKVPGIAM